jgi:hypothetical protein
MRQSVAIGLGEGDLAGRPANVAQFVRGRPDQRATVEQLLGEVAGARMRADAARDAFVATMRDCQADIQLTQYQPSRGRDRRDRAERINDLASTFGSDWAGRLILDRYLRGGPDWRIDNDPAWSRYMMANGLLRGQLQDEVPAAVRDALGDPREWTAVRRNEWTVPVHGRFHAEVENGEGVVGYEFLHGTHRRRGDFEFGGTAHVYRMLSGDYEVRVDMRYTWHDVMDPNPANYRSDEWKSFLAEAATMGEADPYNLDISWNSPLTMHVDSDDGLVEFARGWPFSTR